MREYYKDVEEAINSVEKSFNYVLRKVEEEDRNRVNSLLGNLMLSVCERYKDDPDFRYSLEEYIIKKK